MRTSHAHEKAHGLGIVATMSQTVTETREQVIAGVSETDTGGSSNIPSTTLLAMVAGIL
jgi:hypothetical protein